MPIRHDLGVLQEMAEVHVFYEVERLSLWSTIQLPPSAFNLPDPAVVADFVGQATLESALLHLRSTVDFLVNERPTRMDFETDLVADDYFDDGWSARPDFLLGGTIEEHRDAMTELNRRLAHLSTHRGTLPDGGFNWGDVIGLAPDVLGAVRTFVADLASRHPERARWFDRTIEALDLRQSP